MTDECTNCRRPMSSRECADPAHREARGAKPAARYTGETRECVDPIHQGPRDVPIRQFWQKATNVKAFPTQGRLLKTCSKCRHRRRVRRNVTRRGAALHRQHNTDQFWNQQARQ